MLRIVVGRSLLQSAWSGPQAMPFKIWIEVTGKFQGIDDWLGDLWKAMTLVVGIHEAHVKSIVGNENVPSQKA